jgi:hypothetical protein
MLRFYLNRWIHIVLDVRQLVGQPLAQNISKNLEYELNRPGIGKAWYLSISTITTDNGANMKAAASTERNYRAYLYQTS